MGHLVRVHVSGFSKPELQTQRLLGSEGLKGCRVGERRGPAQVYVQRVVSELGGTVALIQASGT